MTALLAQLATRTSIGEEDALACGLCAHRCVIRPGRAGICGAIVNRDGALHALAAGQPVVQHSDPVERKPLYHVLPGTRLLSIGTLGCNMTCSFCQNWRISQTPPGQEPHTPVPPQAIVAAALAQGCAGIAFTYNEPTIYLDYAADIMQLAQQSGLLTAFKSNGYLTPEAIDAVAPLLDAVNIDLKGFDDQYYRRVCGARLKPVCDAIERFHQHGIWVEVTTLIIPGINDSQAELAALAGFLAGIDPNIPWHIWRFHPDYRMRDVPWTHVDAISQALQIGQAAGLHYVYASNTPGDPGQHTRCPGCGTILIERVGNATTALRLHNGICRECSMVIPGRFAVNQ